MWVDVFFSLWAFQMVVNLNKFDESNAFPLKKLFCFITYTHFIANILLVYVFFYLCSHTSVSLFFNLILSRRFVFIWMANAIAIIIRIMTHIHTRARDVVDVGHYALKRNETNVERLQTKVPYTSTTHRHTLIHTYTCAQVWMLNESTTKESHIIAQFACSGCVWFAVGLLYSHFLSLSLFLSYSFIHSSFFTLAARFWYEW